MLFLKQFYISLPYIPDNTETIFCLDFHWLLANSDSYRQLLLNNYACIPTHSQNPTGVLYGRHYPHINTS
jgi:hypothetical protein